MASWRAVAGATLLIPSGPKGERHLFVVLNDPRPFPGYGAQACVALVNLSTIREGAELDETCVLEPGCHSFVKRRSFVLYRAARLEPGARVEQLVKQAFFKAHLPFEPSLLAIVKAGLKASPFTKREFKQFDL